MNLIDKIATIEARLAELSRPATEIPNTEVQINKASCPTHGEYDQRTRVSTGPIRLPVRGSECPNCLRDELLSLQSQKMVQDSDQRKRQSEKLLEQLNIPVRFADCTLNNYDPVSPEAARCLKVCRAYAEKWTERLSNGGGLVMCGKPGTGKNHLALAIAKHVIAEHQSSALFTTALRIARYIKSTWSKGSDMSESEAIKIYTRPDLLIIDEVGVQFGSDTEKMILFEIINTRYEQMKPTILISNQSRDELAEFIGERVIDRMNDGGGCTLAFTWDSYRSRAA